MECKFSYIDTRTVTNNYKGKGHPITSMKAQRGSRRIGVIILNFGARRKWVENNYVNESLS